MQWFDGFFWKLCFWCEKFKWAIFLVNWHDSSNNFLSYGDLTNFSKMSFEPNNQLKRKIERFLKTRHLQCSRTTKKINYHSVYCLDFIRCSGQAHSRLQVQQEALRIARRASPRYALSVSTYFPFPNGLVHTRWCSQTPRRRRRRGGGSGVGVFTTSGLILGWSISPLLAMPDRPSTQWISIQISHSNQSDTEDEVKGLKNETLTFNALPRRRRQPDPHGIGASSFYSEEG